MTEVTASKQTTKSVAQTVKLSVFTLAIMNVAAVVSLRGLPAEAEYGLGSIFYYLFAAVFFLIPVSLVAAELASTLPQKGGIFRWVGEAFGPHIGFLAIWLLWIESTIWFPTVLTFAAVSLAFIGPDQTWDQALSANKFYVLATCLIIYWGATLVNLRGVAAGAKLSKYGALIGTIIPGAIIILFGILWVLLGNPIQMPINKAELIPDLTQLNNLVLASSIFLFYAGMEMNAVHVREIDNPSRNYPRAIFLSSAITVALFVLGTMAIGFIIPRSEINLTQSLLVAYFDYFNAFGLGFLAPVMAIALAIGVLAGVSTWIGGPSRGLLSVGHAGYLPPFMQKTNKNGIQINILLIQGGVVTLLVLLFVVLPSVQAAYQILSQLTIMLYLIMYVLMFTAAIYLRFRSPNLPRPYKVPGGTIGMVVIGGIGLAGALLAYGLSFLPPAQIAVGSPVAWVGLLALGNIVFVAIPFIIYALRKPSWKTAIDEDTLEPFTWQRPAEPQAKGK
ncbi:amino acid permease [Pseudovibrio exalbescens]|uniref:putative glutamine/gamma-aminobutyrate antiporter GadC n=1 Tax=Pseudovibrio exalbescens TaxID=197461 RepID=UPI00236654C9|nr:putative glutamine/gamma-aminobutyrate antiporter GadC [Pseudovibrio exalbescens]MDD7911055.1 amino acid permease [Pseudovibrio exalbescens]